MDKCLEVLYFSLQHLNFFTYKEYRRIQSQVLLEIKPSFGDSAIKLKEDILDFVYSNYDSSKYH